MVLQGQLEDAGPEHRALSVALVLHACQHQANTCNESHLVPVATVLGCTVSNICLIFLLAADEGACPSAIQAEKFSSANGAIGNPMTILLVSGTPEITDPQHVTKGKGQDILFLNNSCSTI